MYSYAGLFNIYILLLHADMQNGLMIVTHYLNAGKLCSYYDVSLVTVAGLHTNALLLIVNVKIQ